MHPSDRAKSVPKQQQKTKQTNDTPQTYRITQAKHGCEHANNKNKTQVSEMCVHPTTTRAKWGEYNQNEDVVRERVWARSEGK
jgi:hypothetical protein